MIKRLSDEAIEIVVNKWKNEDWATRYIHLNRGHYEDILPLVAREAERYRTEQIVEWLIEHNTLKGLDHAGHPVGLDLTYEDWQELKKQAVE